MFQHPSRVVLERPVTRYEPDRKDRTDVPATADVLGGDGRTHFATFAVGGVTVYVAEGDGEDGGRCAGAVPNLGPNLEQFRRTLKWMLRKAGGMSTENRARTDGEPLIREVRMEDGGLILYDPDSEEAWIQADGPDSVG